MSIWKRYRTTWQESIVRSHCRELRSSGYYAPVVVRITTTTIPCVITFVATTPSVISQKSAVLISFAAEAWNHASRAAVCIYFLPHDKLPWKFEWSTGNQWLEMIRNCLYHCHCRQIFVIRPERQQKLRKTEWRRHWPASSNWEADIDRPATLPDFRRWPYLVRRCLLMYFCESHALRPTPATVILRHMTWHFFVAKFLITNVQKPCARIMCRYICLLLCITPPNCSNGILSVVTE